MHLTVDMVIGTTTAFGDWRLLLLLFEEQLVVANAATARSRIAEIDAMHQDGHFRGMRVISGRRISFGGGRLRGSWRDRARRILGFPPTFSRGRIELG